MRSKLPLILLVLAALLSLGAAGDLPIASQCRTGMYLPPMNGSPDDDAMEIALVPSATETFRLCHSESKGELCGNATFATGGSTGQSVAANTRGEFQLTSLAANTKHYWRVECDEDGRWKTGWEGSFTTLPGTDNEVRVVMTSDNHLVNSLIGGNATRVQQFRNGVALIAERGDYHAHIDLGDGLYLQCNSCTQGWTVSDDFGRVFGSGSILSYATTSTEAVAFGDARASAYQRRWWQARRRIPSIDVIGNHDGPLQFGDNGYGYNYNSGGYHSYREGAWVETGITLTLPGDLGATGIFDHGTAHGMSDDDGPYRWAPVGQLDYTDMPGLTGCTGTRDAADWSNEWYVDYLTASTFRLKVNDTDATGCNGTPASYGSGDWTLVRGSSMQYVSDQVRAKYFPNHNEVRNHNWGPAEKGVMGPIMLSDYVLVLHLNPFEYTPETFPTDVWPTGNRTNAAAGGWGLGSQQRTGALAIINDAGPGSVLGYANVEIIIVVMHHTLGGHDAVGYWYARGTALESDTVCMDNPSVTCEQDSQCTAYGGGRCQYPRIADSFAHSEWQTLHNALNSFATRVTNGGVPIVAVGHDHQFSGGKKGNVYYYTAGELNAAAGGWISDQDHMRRHDFDNDGWPAYYKSLGKYGIGANMAAGQNFPYEWGSDLDGFTTLVMCPSTGTGACSSGKAEVELSVIVNDNPLQSVPSMHGQTEFTFTLQGP